MIPYARLTPGRGFKPGRAVLYYAQRLVTFPTPRRILAKLIAAGVNLATGCDQSASADAYGGRVLDELRQDGAAVLAPLAPRAAIGRMASYFLQQPVIGADGQPTSLNDLPASAATAAYDLETVVNCPGLLELVNAPSVIEIVSAYLGCKPTLSSLGVRWSFPGSEGQARFHSFHRDVDDWRFLKLFIYLTDVDEGAGPHCYVRTSHRTAFGIVDGGYKREELQAKFGGDRLRTITGPRGTTFLADTIGVHCGEPPTTRARLLLQVQYSLLPVYAFQYAPVAVAAAPVDAYSNRLLLRSADPLARRSVEAV
jgi:hypothetical protein